MENKQHMERELPVSTISMAHSVNPFHDVLCFPSKKGEQKKCYSRGCDPYTPVG